MDANILTIGNIFSQPGAPQHSGLRSGASAERNGFSPVREQSEQPPDMARTAKFHEPRAEDPSKSAPQQRKDFREVIDERTKPGNPDHSRNRSESSPQKAESKAPEQTEPTQDVAIQNPADDEQNKGESAAKIEPNARQHLANLIDGAKREKGQLTAANSSGIKSDGSKPAGTAGSDAVSTETLKNIAAAVSGKDTGEAGSAKTSMNTAAGTTDLIKAGSARELSSDAAAKTTNIGKEMPVAENSAESAPAKAPSKATEFSTDQMLDASADKTTNAGQTKSTTVADPQPSIKSGAGSVIQKTPTETAANGADKTTSTAEALAENPEKSVPSSETDADPAARQTPTKQVRTLGSKIGNDSNNTENPASKTAEVQTHTDQTQSGNNRGTSDSLNHNAAQLFSQNAAQTSATEQANTFSVETKAPVLSEQPQTTPGNGPANVGSQVLEAARNSFSQATGDKEITIQLNPPELGKVAVKFQEQGAEITGTLEVSKAQTRTEIEQALPEMIRGLAESGIAIKRLEVVLSQNDQPDQQSARDTLLQDGQFQQQNSANPGQSGNEQQTAQTTYGPTGRSRYQYQNTADPYEMLVTNTSINLLA